MIPKTQKLRRGNFPKHTDPRKVWIGSCLRIHISLNGKDILPRFAVIVSKKVNTLATRRNELKRTIYDNTPAITKRLLQRTGVRMVITVQKKENQQPTTQQCAEDMQRFAREMPL